MENKFFKYVLTSMTTMLLQSLYSIVDGLFISNLVGDTGLSAVNVSWPIIAVIVALGTGIGCGGSVQMSMKQGAGDIEGSNKVRANIIIALAGVSILVTAAFSIMLPALVRLMGAEGRLYDYAMEYGSIMIMGSAIQIFATGLTPILRNEKKVVQAMSIMVTGLVCNLILDFVFLYVFGLGIKGAAAASLLSQVITVTLCVIVLMRNRENPISLRQFKADFHIIGKIFKIGISPFGISLAPSLLIMFNNIQCIKYGGDTAIAIFSIITSTIGSYRILLIGVAEGIQPLVSYAKGAGDIDSIRRIRNKAIATAVIMSFILFLFTVATAKYYPAIYGASKEVRDTAFLPIIISGTQLIFTGLVRVTNSFFYSIGKNKYSLFMIYFDPIIMTPVLLYVLPRLFGMYGIWISTTVSQVILNIAAVLMYIKHGRSLRREEAEADNGRKINEG